MNAHFKNFSKQLKTVASNTMLNLHLKIAMNLNFQSNYGDLQADDRAKDCLVI